MGGGQLKQGRRPRMAPLRSARAGSWRRDDVRLGLILSLPTALWVGLLIVYPLADNLALSFERGIADYRGVVTDAEFWRQVVRTLVWAMGSLVVIIPLALGIALLLNMKLAWVNHARTWFLMPWMFPVIVVVLIWRWLLDPTVGLIDQILFASEFIDQPVNFFGRDLAMATVIAVNSWRWIPFVAIVLLAAMQDIPQQLYEAAAIDGASAWRRFLHITLPHLRPVLVANTFILMMWLANMFPPIWLMTRGGPDEATMTLPISLYHTAFELLQFRRGAVLAMILFVVVALMAAIYWATFGQERLARKR